MDASTDDKFYNDDDDDDEVVVVVVSPGVSSDAWRATWRRFRRGPGGRRGRRDQPRERGKGLEEAEGCDRIYPEVFGG